MWLFFFLVSFLALFAESSALYLSWFDDPTTTITIQWHTEAQEIDDTVRLKVQDGWESFEGSHIFLEQVLVHTIAFENLTPNTEYSFTIGVDPKIYSFQTAPATLEEPLRFIVGGDVYFSTKLFRRMSQTVLENNPHFIVLGGDLAYALNVHPFRVSPLRRWLSFLKEWKEHMIHPDGKVIPFLLLPGNHDITPNNYNLFFNLFAFPEKQLYRAIDFGSYLSLILLDTGHFQPIEGEQTRWLDEALSTRTDTPYRFAVYHEAAYPSHYDYRGVTPTKIRTHWSPLFEKYNLLAAFEHHNHAFKRTYPIKADQKDLSGVVYIGDGCWGAFARKTHDQWYLEKRGRKNNVVLVELNATQATVKSLDLLNHPLDEITFSPR